MGKLFGRLLLLVAVVALAAIYQFNQVSVVEDPDLTSLAKDVLSSQFRAKSVEEISNALRTGDSFDVAAGRTNTVINEDVTLLAVRESRSLLPWKHSKEVVLQVDFVLQDGGETIAAGRRYLRFARNPELGWGYRGETDSQGFYANLL
jgi:hypothetical protein